jgi:predicted metalloendopeptidase
MSATKSLFVLCVAGLGLSAVVAQDLTREEMAAEVAAAMDPGADPCTDFYRYACGGWLDATELPGDKDRWVRSFSVIDEANRELVREILEEAAASSAEDPVQAKIGSFYGSCMDEEAVEKAGASPLQPWFDKIAAADDQAAVLALTGELHRVGVPAWFQVGTIPDFEDPDLNIAWIFQGGLGMPDRDYYVSEDPKKQELLAAYQVHVARMFALLGEDEETAARSAAAVVELETALAEASRPREEMRDFERLYNKIDLVGLQELTPGLTWSSYLEGVLQPAVTGISVAVPEFMTAMEKAVLEAGEESRDAYLRWNVVNAMAPDLSTAFVDADFDFYGRTLRGTQENEPRWKRCVSATQRALGEVVGQAYVDRRFAGSSKDVALTMIEDIEHAFENGLPALAWMDETTRSRAKEKVATLIDKIGYPDRWRDYSGLEVVADSYFANRVAADAFEFDYEADKIGKPVDRSEWGMTPQQVNAYYNPLWNEIVFPAGILQPPFFHKDFPAAMNYGGIGGVIGHELTHGFDDQGRKFAPDGRLREWWEPEVAGRFEERAQCVADFYSQFEVAPGAKVNGQLTLGENIADIGGVKESYDAYKAWEERNGAPQPLVAGLTNDQHFFVSWSQVWCSIATEERERLQVTTDPHSPAKFRATAPLMMHPGFAAAFQCEPGTPMAPADRCEVW